MNFTLRPQLPRIAMACLCLFLGFSPANAWAMKNRTVVLRAAGTGAVLGLGVGLVSSAIAGGKNTIISGAVVGALLGTVYGFYLVDQRKRTWEVRTDRPDLLGEGMRFAGQREEPRTLKRDGILLPLPNFSFSIR